MESIDIKQLVWAGILVAVGIILPVIFHSIGAGSVFLPMHIPILLGGFILSWPFAISVAFVTPLLSSIFTGMPAFAYLLYMVPELVTYALVISILFKKNEKAPFAKCIYLTMGIAMIIGRLVASLFQAILLANNQGIIAFFTSSIITGIPGIILQLIVIPAILYGLLNARFLNRNIA